MALPVENLDRINRARIRYLLELSGESFSSAAIRIGVSTSLVGAVAARRSKSRRVESALAEIIGMKVESLFPDLRESKENDPHRI